LSTLLSQYPDTLISLMVHTSGWTTAWGTERRYFYALQYVPTAEWDGWYEYVGSDNVYNVYHQAYLNCLARPTDVTIDLTAYKVAANQLKVVAELGVEPGGAGKTMRVHMVLALDHWPPGYDWCRDSVKAGQNKGDIVLNPGESAQLTQEFTLDADCLAQPNDVKVVVFAQEPLAAKPAQVYNANFLHGPFGFRKGDLNCDGLADFGDINPFVLALTNPAAYAVQFPNCDIMTGDINEDGFVDFGDINPFVRLLTNP
jgi:hypothetical protein